MALFQKATMTSAYLKMGIMGFAGAGKTYTATKAAIGLIELMRKREVKGCDLPLFFLDTETGSDWVQPQCDEAGIEMFTAKTRAFSDLLTAVDEAQRSSSVLLVDSITHFWTELCDSYAERKKRKRGLEFQDWAFLKREWAKFTDAFINAPVHIIICGRAGFEYDHYVDETGKKQIEKTDVKMQTEKNMGYEPSLLVLMERKTDPEQKKTTRVGYVLKDRSASLDGKWFTNPKFKDFLPHIKFLNLGGEHLGVDVSRNSNAMIPKDERDDMSRQRKIVLAEIQDLLTYHYPGQSAAEKKAKIGLLREHFDASWAEIESVMTLDELRTSYNDLHLALEATPSKYAPKPEDPSVDEDAQFLNGKDDQADLEDAIAGTA